MRAARTVRALPAAERQWRRGRRAGLGWAVGGIAIGTLVGLLGWAPANWLAAWVDDASGGHLLLADAAGTVWDGDAVLLLAGGPGSRDASALPGRISWRLRPAAWGLELHARHACCLDGELALTLQPRWNGASLRFAPPLRSAPEAGRIGQWPASWLSGLGTPWNTLRLGGTLRLASQGLRLQWRDGQVSVDGLLLLDLDEMSSRVSQLPALGSYRLRLSGTAGGGDVAQIALETRDGALLLSGSGQWSAAGLRFRGEARAAEGQEPALANLLNIIVRRQGARSVLSIG